MKKIIFISLTIFLVGCTTVSGTKNLSQEMVSTKIIKSKTTKEEISSLLGKPTNIMITQYQMPIVDMTKYGGIKIDMSESMPYETWTYSKITQHLFKDNNFLISILSGRNYYPTEVTSLAICFDKNGVVQSYSFSENK